MDVGGLRVFGGDGTVKIILCPHVRSVTPEWVGMGSHMVAPISLANMPFILDKQDWKLSIRGDFYFPQTGFYVCS